MSIELHQTHILIITGCLSLSLACAFLS